MTWNTDWQLDPDASARRLGERYPKSGAESLAIWAALTVEGLHYLADVDAALRRPPSSRDVRTGATYHRADAVQQAHARWATADAVTAIDLCAGALGRMHCGYPKDSREMDFHDARRDQALLALAEPSAWITAVRGDADYRDLWPLREQLVHRYAVRTIELGGVHSGRVSLHRSGGALIAIEDLVPWCRDVALRHVRAFLDAVERL